MDKRSLAEVDPQIREAINHEIRRINNTLELIASENFASLAVMEAQGSPLTNKYAEGYPGKRYYGGCQYVDIAESLAKERAVFLFGAEHVNVQPHSGAQANMAACLALLKPGDKIMGMRLSHGGHLTHGTSVNISGIFFKNHPYGVDRDTEVFNLDHLMCLAKEVKPRLIIVGASAYPRQIDFSAFRKIADGCGAYLMADIAHIAGLVVADQHPTPIPYCDIVTTTTHKTLRGPRGGMILCRKDLAKAVDSAVFPGIQGGPLMHVIAAKAVCFKEAMEDEFKQYQVQIIENAKALAEELQSRGFRLVSGGTDTHLILIDLTPQGLSGKEVEEALDESGISVNKNQIPYDTKSAVITSGIRIGTPAITTRGMGLKQMRSIAHLIYQVTQNVGNKKVYKEVREAVTSLCQSFPIYEP